MNLPSLSRISSFLGCHKDCVKLLQNGENATYRIETPEELYALRLYRPGRRSEAEVAAEWAWADEIAKDMPTPVLHTLFGQRIHRIEGFLAVGMEWVDGKVLQFKQESFLACLGQVIGKMSVISNGISNRMPADWIGRTRPHLEAMHWVNSTMKNLEESAFMEANQWRVFANLVSRLKERFPTTSLTFDSWVHGDLHAGNLMKSDDGIVLIDLDDSMWTCKEMEWAQPRVHLHANNCMEQWPLLMSSSGLSPNMENVKIATSLFLVYTIASFSQHQDLEVFKSPHDVIERYTGYLRAELA